MRNFIAGFYRRRGEHSVLVYNPPMPMPAVLQRYAQIPYPLRQAVAAALWVLFGLCILPAGIFAAGVALLGRYDGGSLEQTYASIFSGLGTGSAASWGVVLGPYLLFLLLKGLLLWWRTAAKWAA